MRCFLCFYGFADDFGKAIRDLLCAIYIRVDTVCGDTGAISENVKTVDIGYIFIGKRAQDFLDELAPDLRATVALVQFATVEEGGDDEDRLRLGSRGCPYHLR